VQVDNSQCVLTYTRRACRYRRTNSKAIMRSFSCYATAGRSIVTTRMRRAFLQSWSNRHNAAAHNNQCCCASFHAWVECRDCISENGSRQLQQQTQKQEPLAASRTLRIFGGQLVHRVILTFSLSLPAHHGSTP
jgi:hypothetical protein